MIRLYLVFLSFFISLCIFAQAPNTQFSVSQQVANVGTILQFNNTSVLGGLKIQQIEWDFGDGKTSINYNPSHVYLLPGTYQVTLTIKTSGGTNTSTKPAYITINPALNAAFYASDTSGCTDLSVQFTDASYFPNVSDPIINWNWDFGDGTTFIGKTPPPHIYPLGKYTVKLVVTTQNGSSNVVTMNNYIKVGKINTVNFSITPNNVPISCAKRNYSFTNLSTLAGNYDSTDVQYIWSFGDGDTSSKQHPIYNFPADTGYMNIQLLVNYRGCKDSIIKNNLLYIKSPISNFTLTKLICNPVDFPATPLRVTVLDKSIIGKTTDNVAMSWQWGGTNDPDDVLTHNDIFDQNKGDTAHTFTAYGTYFVKQIIHNYTMGCSDSTTKAITISKLEPNFSLSNDTICIGNPITITNTSIYTDPAIFCSFNLGNSQVKNGNLITYTYPNPGTFNITLKATNAAGCVKSLAYNNIKVLEKPIASIVVADTNGCKSKSFLFSNQSSTPNTNVPLTQFNWTLPDGSSQTTQQLSDDINYVFNSTGTFTTSLIAKDQFGCVSSSKSIQIKIDQPTANFTLDTVICNLTNFSTTNTSSGNSALSYSWKIDNQAINNNQNLNSNFNESLNNTVKFIPHTIKLITTDAHNCSDSISKIIKVSLPKAIIHYQASGSTQNLLGEYICPPVLETYSDSSKSYGTIQSWNWTFGNFFTSTLQNPINNYVFPGIFSTSLSIIDEFGCTADTTISNYLKILGPTASINSVPTGAICDHSYQFTASNFNSVNNFIWDFGDNTSANDSISIIHSYSIGNYSPVLKLFDSNQCEVQFPIQTITISSSSIFGNAGNDQTICSNTCTMNASASLLGTKTWKLISGAGLINDSLSPTTTVSNLGSGENKFTWTITEGCDKIIDTVIIINSNLISKAGNDTLFCSTNLTLNANQPSFGTGTWSILNGNGTFNNSNLANATISNLANGNNSLIWTLNNQCSTASDTLTIFVETNPTIPNAGINDTICDNFYQLKGNQAIIGLGKWDLLVGNATITQPSFENSTVTNLGLGKNILQWKISNTCKSDSTTVIIIRNDVPTPAKTIDIQPICDHKSQLSGNKPIIGIGEWHLIQGKGTISNVFDSITNVSNLQLGKNIFRWKITSSCGADSSDVVVIVDTIPSNAIVGENQEFCGGETILSANKPIYGKGKWSIVNGYGLIFDSTDYSSGIAELPTGLTLLKWSISNSCGTKFSYLKLNNVGNCPDEDSLAKVLIYFIPNTFTPNDDKENPTFTPIFTSGIDPFKYTLQVFNRWGNIVFESHDATVGWDGTFGGNGEIVSEGIYNWRIDFVEILTNKEHSNSGNVLLIK